MRVAAPVIEAVVGTGLPGQGNLLVLGVDMTGDRSLREYDLARGDEAILDDPLVFLAQPDSIMVSDRVRRRGTARRSNSRVPLETMDGPKEFTVRGILRSSGLSSAFGGNLAIMDIYAAQHVFGRGRKFDRIDLAVAKGADVAARAGGSCRRCSDPASRCSRPRAAARASSRCSRIYRFMLLFSSAFALLVGMFIIYNAFAIAVTQRRGEIGLLRALGATRGADLAAVRRREPAARARRIARWASLLGQAAARRVARGAARLVQGRLRRRRARRDDRADAGRRGAGRRPSGC